MFEYVASCVVRPYRIIALEGNETEPAGLVVVRVTHDQHLIEGPGRYSSPRYSRHFERSFHEVNHKLNRGERYVPGPTSTMGPNCWKKLRMAPSSTLRSRPPTKILLPLG
jgi:hypothetical protein